MMEITTTMNTISKADTHKKELKISENKIKERVDGKVNENNEINTMIVMIVTGFFRTIEWPFR